MIVIADASAVGSFLLADEGGPLADFARLVCSTNLVHVPSIWPAETASLILIAHRRNRINDVERDEALVAAGLMQRSFRIEPDEPIAVIATRAAELGLSAYDTTYLILAERLGGALLTGDGPLQRGCTSRRIECPSPMTIRTRFAPSPTGFLHVGNIRTALHNWLWARKMGGEFWLRIDDTDAERSEERFTHAIRADLDWLGMTPDGEERQSARSALYQARFEALRDAGRIYPAYETAQELDLKRKIAAGRGLPPIYDRAALALSDTERAALEADGVRPHWRFKLDHATPIVWDDLVRGAQSFEPATMSDPVIRRADGSWLYMLPSAIDDVEMGITHVVRGEDHVSNTALQLQMFAAMGAPPPAFAHAALLTGAEGKLSKRLGSLGVAHFREVGIEPQAVRALLARIGTSDPVEPIAEAAPLVASFDFARFGRAPARFDEAELAGVNARILHTLPFAAVAGRLPAGMGEAEWAAVRPNLATVAEAADWWHVIEGPIETAAASEDAAFLAAAARLAETIDWSADPWHALTAALKDETGRTGKALFLPLRRALTARDHGPDMKALLPLIGRERAIERLSQS